MAFALSKICDNISGSKILKCWRYLVAVSSCFLIKEQHFQREAELFEKDIVCSASENGGPGIVLLPGVKPIIDLVRALSILRF